MPELEEITGRDALQLLAACHPSLLDKPLAELLGAVPCPQCGGPHLTTWEQLVCEQLLEARTRRAERGTTP